LQETLNKVLVFNKMERHLQRKVVSEMYERTVSAGEILIKEGDTGLAAAELYVVKSGKFEVRLGKAGKVAASATTQQQSVGLIGHRSLAGIACATVQLLYRHVNSI
jgi:CRP-like cAMP-binding protein